MRGRTNAERLQDIPVHMEGRTSAERLQDIPHGRKNECRATAGYTTWKEELMRSDCRIYHMEGRTNAKRLQDIPHGRKN